MGSRLLFCLLVLSLRAAGQGRVVINEFMAWSGCSDNSEFVELLNFGPGPMDIGCYVVTNGQFSVTIPPGTVLKPGAFYVLAGQDTLRRGCGNADSAVRVQLNWHSCGCSTVPVPGSSDGYFKDGGGANEKVVLMDASGRVLDAVSRQATAGASALLTTAGGACPPRIFDLDDQLLTYESINSSSGIDNSFARRVDGDCGWVKTTAISAGAPNKTGSTSSASYSFTTVDASECAERAGVIAIGVSAPEVATLFPMSYTLAFDSDSNGVFDDRDQYQHGADSSAPSIAISNLAYGRYRITVASAMGCNLKNFDFFIFNCYGVVLPLRLHAFAYEGIRGGEQAFSAHLSEGQGGEVLHLEGAEAGGGFRTVSSLQLPEAFGEKKVQLLAPVTATERYRLRVVEKDGSYYYSPVIRVAPLPVPQARLWPNPVGERLQVPVTALRAGVLRYRVVDRSGTVRLSGEQQVPAGASVLSLPVHTLPGGLYYLSLSGALPDGALQGTFLK